MGALKGTKKRETSGTAGPPNKKRKERSDDRTTLPQDKKAKGKGKAVINTPQKPSKAFNEPKKAQRKVPVTSTVNAIGESSGSDSDFSKTDDDEVISDGFEGEDGDFEGVEEEEAEFEDGTRGEDDMLVDEGTLSKEKSSARESHKVQKALQQERRAAKQHSDILSAAKPLWALARRKEVPKEERVNDIANLHNAVRGRVQDVVLKHDASRIIQTLVKHGSQTTRDEIASELSGRFRELSQNKYSKFLVTKLVRLCPKKRASILAEFKGHVVRLLLHREASGVLADSFELYANAYERALLTFDFYGKEVSLFTPALAKGTAVSEEEKSQLKKGLAGVLEGADQERRNRVLSAVKEKLYLIMNNPDKGAMSHAIFHRVLWEYLSELNKLDDEVLREKLRHDIFESCQEQLADMVHTKDGSRLVREFIAQGSAKDRKQVVKVLKPHVEKICKDDDAQTVLFTALDMIDDTKLTAKSLVAEVTSRARTLYVSAQGRRALLHLLVPRTPRHFTPALSAVLAETDAIRERTSKKDPESRKEEILKAASRPLIELLESASGEGGEEDKGCIDELMRDPGGSLLVTEIMLEAEGDKTKAMKSLIGLLQHPYPSTLPVLQHVIDVPHAARAYKTLLQGGHFSKNQGTVVRPSKPDIFNPVLFARVWLQSVNAETTKTIGLGGGTFVLTALVEIVKKEGSDADRQLLEEQLDETFVRKVEESELKGKQILLNALR